MKFSHVVAASENDVIGKAGGLPWHLKEDLKRFKALTMGHCIIMGRKTFDSIGRVLPGRKTIVVSSKPGEESTDCVYVKTIQQALDLARDLQPKFGDTAFIVGGGEIYRQTLEFIDIIYLTRIHQKVAGDTFYPPISAETFVEYERQDFQGDFDYSFISYRRL